eukprot:jgi/Tetstr1/448719/TSEL_035956.t1
MTRRRAPLVPLSGNVVAGNTAGRRKLDGKSGGEAAGKAKGAGDGRKRAGGGRQATRSRRDNGSAIPTPPARLVLGAAGLTPVAAAAVSPINRPATGIPKPPSLRCPGPKAGARRAEEHLVHGRPWRSGDCLPGSDEDAQHGGKQGCTTTEEQLQSGGKELAGMEVTPLRSPMELCGHDLDTADFSFQPGCSGDSQASQSLDIEPPIPAPDSSMMDTGQGDGLHGTTLRSMLSQYLFSPGSSASGSNAKGAAPSPATAPDVPSAALDPHHPAQEEESPFAALCRKLYQSPANSDAPTTGLEHQDSIAPAGLTHAESASLELGVEPEGSPPCDGLDTWLANCNPQLRAAAGSPVSRRRLEELWHAAMETASLRMRLQAYESSSPESSCPAVESEEAGGACGGYPSGTAAKVDAEGQAHRREETIRAELAGLQRRLGTLRAASEAALTAAEGLSGCYPRRPEPPSGNVSSRNQGEAGTPASRNPSQVAEEYMLRAPNAVSVNPQPGDRSFACDREPSSSMLFHLSNSGGLSGRSTGADFQDGAHDGPGAREAGEEVHIQPKPLRSETPATAASNNPLYDSDDSPEDEDYLLPGGNPISLASSRGGIGRRPFASRPAMNESAAAPGGRTAVVGALDECDVDAAAATRRWARARELQRRAKALGLRMS